MLRRFGYALAFSLTLTLAVVCVPRRAGAQQPQTGGLGEIRPLRTPASVPTLPPLGEAPAGAKAADPKGTPAAPAPARLPVVSPSVMAVLAVGLIVMVATVFVVLSVVMKEPVVINVTSRGGAGGFEGPPPADWVESGMVRMGRPPEGTLKILPGRFMIDDGDRMIELRIFRTTGADRVETTIGREEGPAYRHIQLKPLSVSAKHAKLVHENGVYSVVNYSATNPTLINGEALPQGASRRLVEGDRLEVGEVAMTYYES